jgi:uncharacterized protein
MEMQGSRTLVVSQQQAWAALNDPEILKACIPGCEKLDATSDNQYAVVVAVKIGPVSARFSGKLQLSEVYPPNGYTITFDGQGGAAVFGKGISNVSLSPLAGGQGCELGYSVTAQVGGKIAQVGARLIDGVAKSMAEDFFKRFDGEMQRLYPESDAPAAHAVQAMQSEVVPAACGHEARRLPGWVWAWAWAAYAGVVIGAFWFVTR